MTDVTGTDLSFRTRFVGFDRNEVRTFIGNILEDYARVRDELERLRVKGARPDRPDDSTTLDTTARDVRRLLEGAQRVADDLERRAAEEGAQLVAQAHTDAAALLAAAEIRATEITEDARREVARLQAQAAALQEYGLRLRGAFEAAADAAAAALSDMAASRLGNGLPGDAAKVAV